MIIEFIRNGKSKRMNPKLARVLAKKGHVRIADVGVQTAVVEKPAAVEPQVEVAQPAVSESPDLDAMGIDELRELAAALNVPVHHRAGEEKIRSDIRAHMA